MLTAFKAELAHEGPLVGLDNTTQAEIVVQPGIIIMQVRIFYAVSTEIM